MAWIEVTDGASKKLVNTDHIVSVTESLNGGCEIKLAIARGADLSQLHWITVDEKMSKIENLLNKAQITIQR